MFEMSFDPLLFWPSTVVDLIFQHLKGKEILTASLVSTSWEEHIGSSLTCMGKLTLTIIGRNYFLSGRENELKEELKSLSARLAVSRRRYENFTLYAQKPGSLTREVIELLNSRQGKWKSVRIWSEKFRDERQLKTLLNAVSRSAESIDLRNINFVQSRQYSEPSDDLLFPNLRSLSLCNVKSCEQIIRIFNHSYKINSLKIENAFEDLSMDLSNGFPANFARIEKLSIAEAKFHKETFQKLSRLNLKLKELEIKSLSGNPILSHQIAPWLKLQSETLQTVEIDAFIDVELMNALSQLSKLKKFNWMTMA